MTRHGTDPSLYTKARLIQPFSIRHRKPQRRGIVEVGWLMIELKRSACAILSLVLKGKWFDMIASGEKREEYRMATDYWLKRLANWDLHPAGTPIVEFRLGYAKDAPSMAFWVFGLNTESGMKTYALVDRDTDKPRHPEWGEPTEPHFFIKLGGRVELQDDCEVPDA